MIMVLLVLKLFVSSRPLKLEGILGIYVLLFHEGQAKNQFAMFFYSLRPEILFVYHSLNRFYKNILPHGCLLN
jgi:hypothetical protein